MRAPCPQCDRGPKDDALAITVDHRGAVKFCHRCGFTEAVNVLTHTSTSTSVKAQSARWSELAEAIWRRTVPLEESLAQKYLLSRRCLFPPSDGDLRYLPATKTHPASMVARITDAITAEPMSLHFTRLAVDGAKIDRRLLAGHVKRGGVIRLWPDEAVAYGLAVAEGIESALSAAHACTPIWSTIDAGNLSTFPVLAGIVSLTIFADNDAAGLKAARDCGRRWRDEGCDVRIRAADTGDVNDIVRGAA